MGDYSRFLRSLSPSLYGASANAQDFFNQLFDNSHGRIRYYLRNTPWGFVRSLEDKAQKEQDRYDNTGVDPAYADRIDSSLLGAGVGVAGGLARGVGRMARSLADLYVPDVSEDVSPKNPIDGYF